VPDDGIRTRRDESVVFQDGEVEGEEPAEGIEADASELGKGDDQRPSDEIRCG